MVYDHKSMKWIGNSEDDIFGDIIDFEPDSITKPVGKTEKSEFEIDQKQREAFSISESAHKLFISKFYPRAVTDSKSMMRDTSKAHLYEIRNLV
jgi:hypothetical protein